MRGTTESYHVAPRLHMNPSSCSCPSAFLSLSDPFPDVYAQSTVCVSRLPLPPSYASSSSSLLPLLHSVAAVLVMALCPWCKLAAGSQVAHMTVIDVQVFNSSHTETPQQHTHAYGATDKHRRSMHVRVYTLWLFTCTHRSLYSSSRCRGGAFNKEKTFSCVRLSQATVTSVAEENREACDSVACYDFFSIYDCFFSCRTASISPCAQRRHTPDVSG